MELDKIIFASLKNVFFGLIVVALLLPLLLSVPVIRDYFLSAISLVGLGE